MRTRWTPSASRDLDTIEAYISQDSSGAAVRTVVEIIRAVDQLKNFPALGRAGRVASTRELVIAGKPYIATYRVKNNVIEILRVFHTAQK